MAEKLSITVTPGPLKISGARSIHFCGEPLSVEGDAYVCRCGGSSTPPFCDGTHKKNGFSGDNPERQNKPLQVWQGQTLRTHFNPNACMHVFFCKPLAELRKREESGEQDVAEEIMRVVSTCPSGALTYELTQERTEPQPDESRPEIDIRKGGEIRVQRLFELNHERLERQPSDRATLCRCGLSKNKPFCDGKHAAKKNFT
jgi:CDGSH-type Zn-finger protein